MKGKHYVVAMFALLLTILLIAGAGECRFSTHDYEWPRDLGGRDIRINTRWSGAHGITPFDISQRGVLCWYDPDPRLEAWIEEVEEWFNVNIEFVEPIIQEGSAMQQMAEMFLAGDINFDYTDITRDDALPLHAEAFLRPLDDIFVDDYIQAMPDRWRFLYRPPLTAHKMFGIPYMFEAMGREKGETGIFWNKRIFEEAGLPTPYELWDDDEWTIEILEELAQALTMDTTGDGTIDQYGLATMEGRYWNNLLVANEGALTMPLEDKMQVTITKPETIWMWEWLVRIRNDLEVMGGSPGDTGRGRAAMEFTWFAYIQREWMQDSEDEIGFLPFPQGPDAEYHRVPTGNIWMGVLPVTVDEPRSVVEVVNALFRFKYPYIDPGLSREEQFEAWYEGFWSDWELMVFDRRSIEFLRYMTPRVVHSDHRQTAEHLGFWDAIHAIDVEGRSVSATMHELEPAFQAVIDEMYEY